MSDKTIHSVMIVDDDKDDRDLARRRLERSGRYRYVLDAADGREALALFETYQVKRRATPEGFPPLLMLLDINMPVVSGFDLLERLDDLAGAEQTRVVVMLSSSDAVEDRTRAAKYARVADYLVKPLSKADALSLADRFGEVGQ
ncbi:MAG: response regulator [Myxococcota bacterium]